MPSLLPANRAFLQMLRAATLLALVAVVLIIAIEAWKTWIVAGERRLIAGDYVFFTILAGLFIGLAWLRHAISRGLREP